jgi:hypothetical protein
MIGSAFEGILLSFVDCYSEEAATSKKAPHIKGKVKPLLRWSLFELVVVARDLNWLPAGLSLDDDWKQAKAQIGDYAKVVQETRNLVHPAVYVEDFHRKRITKKRLNLMFDIVGTALDYLMEKISKSSEIYMEKEKAKAIT